MGPMGHAVVDKCSHEHAWLCVQISLLQAYRSQHLEFRLEDLSNSPLPRPLVRLESTCLLWRSCSVRLGLRSYPGLFAAWCAHPSPHPVHPLRSGHVHGRVFGACTGSVLVRDLENAGRRWNLLVRWLTLNYSQQINHTCV